MSAVTKAKQQLAPRPLAHTTTDSEVLVRVDNVSKKFCRSLKKSLWYGIKDIADELNPFGRKSLANEWEASLADHSSSLRDEEFWAVDDVSFELRRGECLGLIGHNGAGKTTLLKMLNGLIKPDRGRIEMRGRVGAIIALGAGFNPILTGRENIYVNASILGISRREIDEKLEDIVDFAEVGEFIDAPVQNYSSGMQVRLGFAVATALKPDILLLDEVLAVGDAAFKSKSLLRINSLLTDCAVIFVSHSESQVQRIATRGLLMSAGKVNSYGQIGECYRRYHELRAVEDPAETDPSIFSVQLHSVSPGRSVVNYLDECIIEFELSSRHLIKIDLLVFGFRSDGNFWAQSWQNVEITLGDERQTLQARFSSIPLAEGDYDLTVSMFSNAGKTFQYQNDRLSTVAVRGKKGFHVKTQVPVTIEEL